MAKKHDEPDADPKASVVAAQPGKLPSPSGGSALSRRELLERTGAALGLLAGAGCVEGDEAGPPMTSMDPSASPRDPQGPPTVDGPDPSDPRGDDGDEPAPAPSDDGNASAQAGSGAEPTPNEPMPGDDASAAGGGDEPPAMTSPPDGNSGADTPADPGGNDMTAPEPTVTGVPVAFVRRDDLDEAVARAVALAGGIDEIQAGQTVFIKPNAVSNRALETPGIRTGNEVLAAVVRLVKARNPGRIIVGDRSARGFDSEQVFDNSGMREAALAAGADEVYAAPEATSGEDDHWVLVQTPNYEEVWAQPGGLLVMRKIIDADHLINVPTCKNHRYALFSLSLKNFVGGIGDSSRDPLHYISSIGSDFKPLGRDIALLNQAFAPLINILDTTTALVNGGPQGDGADAVRASPGLVLASKDRVALDTAGVSLIKHELSRVDVPMPDGSHRDLMSTRVWDMPQIENAIDLGLGVTGASEASLVFDGMDEADAMAVEEIWRA